MKTAALLFLIWTAFTGVAADACAQHTAYPFRRLSIGEGLSHNQVHAIFQDRRGFIWFGTLSGLNRYDGYGFKYFRRDLKDSASLSDDYVTGIFQGPENKLWISTQSGMNIYDPVTETFDRHPERFLRKAGISGSVQAIAESGQGHYWLLTETGKLYRYDELLGAAHAFAPSGSFQGMAVTGFMRGAAGTLWLVFDQGILLRISDKTMQVLHTVRLPGPAGRTRDYSLYADTDGDVWVHATDAPEGVFFYQSKSGKIQHIHSNAAPGVPRLKNDMVNDVVQDDKGRIWLCTDHGGVALLNKHSGSVTYLMNRPGDERSIGQNSITTAYRDREGIIWLGTFKKGISYYHEQMIRFPLYRHLPGQEHSLPYDDVNRFVEDRSGNLWIGTNGGGLIYFDRTQHTFTRYLHDPSDPGSLSNNVVVSLCIDYRGMLWVGTYQGGLNCFDGEKFIHYTPEPGVPGQLRDDSIWEIFEDSEKRLWIGTLSSGLYLLERESGTFRNFSPQVPGTVRSEYISCLMEDRGGNLWIGTADGIDVLRKDSEKFIHYDQGEGAGNLSNGHVIALLQDRQGRIWAGTRDGLNLFDQESGTFVTFRVNDGLPDNVILTMLEDNAGNLWVSTPKGISRITLSDANGKEAIRFFRNYDELDGLQGREFNENAALKTRKGELIFGGPGGFNLFLPDAIQTHPGPPRVVLTGFRLFNKPVQLQQAMPEARELTLRHDQDVFSIEFAALNYVNPEKSIYTYKLEGFNNDWMAAGEDRVATYTNLDPGEYVFRVRAASGSGPWNEQGAGVLIRILPPFWKTPLAYLLYAALAVAALYAVRKLEMRRMRARYALEQERLQARRMHELDLMKIRFFTNVSHEFRTPLSLILAPLDQLLKQAKDPALQRSLQMIGRNARRLMNLVNQLLDFRKMEVQELQLQLREGDLVECLKAHFSSFSDLAEKKHIHYRFQTTADRCLALFDHDKLERILFNLLSNAFKFTPDGGCISLELAVDGTQKGSGIRALIKVRDSGIGIPPDKQEGIFRRFFQLETPGSMINQGSGIGLAITREFVTLHGGAISVESREGKGSCFSVKLPLAAAVPAPATNTPSLPAPEPEERLLPGNARPGKPLTVLLIDDYEDFRFYLKDNLKQHFQIAEAADGQTGWAQTLSCHPDLVVSDVDMPGMDGIALCTKIKNDPRTAHIPVILLTALSSEELHIRGLRTGASDYVTKPFNFEILLSKIRNILDQKQAMEKTYRKQVAVIPREPDVELPDEKFARKALQVVEKNINNPDLSVDFLSREMHMSRVALYKKLRSLTGQTPTEFIRSIRLKKAAALLRKPGLQVSEIAYEVGFSNPKHFSRHFKAEFGMVPTEYSRSAT